MEGLGAVVDTKRRIVTLEHVGVVAKFGIVLDIDLDDDEGTDSDDFTSDEEDPEESGSDSSDDELVLAVRAEAKEDDAVTVREEAVDLNMAHLSEGESSKIGKCLLESGDIAESLHDLPQLRFHLSITSS